MKFLGGLESRQRTIISWAIRIGVVTLGVYSIGIEPNRLVVNHQQIELDNWTAPPLRVAMISDLHFGALFMTREKFRDVVAKTNAEHPDLILLLGDYVASHRGQKMPRGALDAIGELGQLHARLGTYAVYGNHDWWADGSAIVTRGCARDRCACRVWAVVTACLNLNFAS